MHHVAVVSTESENSAGERTLVSAPSIRRLIHVMTTSSGVTQYALRQVRFWVSPRRHVARKLRKQLLSILKV